MASIHGFSDTAEALGDTAPQPWLINRPTSPRCGNPQILNLEIHKSTQRQCTNARCGKLSQKLTVQNWHKNSAGSQLSHCDSLLLRNILTNSTKTTQQSAMQHLLIWLVQHLMNLIKSRWLWKLAETNFLKFNCTLRVKYSKTEDNNTFKEVSFILAN